MITKNTAEDWNLENTVVILGNFDGIHKGHQLLVAKAKEYSVRLGYKMSVLTFLPHPLKLFCVDNFKLIYTEDEKEDLFKKEELDYYIIFPFDEDHRSMKPEDFVQTILVEKLGAKAIVVGSDYRFGKKAMGDTDLLKRLLEPKGVEVIVLNKLQAEGEDISSTRLRNFIAQGDFGYFKKLTGRDFHLRGKVVHGKKLGRKLGFPTANVIPDEDKVLPPNGVYFVKVHWKEQIFDGLCNLGISPSLEGRPYSAETYILDFNQNIYDETIEILFIKYLRPEIQFESMEELKLQIEKDVLNVRHKLFI